MPQLPVPQRLPVRIRGGADTNDRAGVGPLRVQRQHLDRLVIETMGQVEPNHPAAEREFHGRREGQVVVVHIKCVDVLRTEGSRGRRYVDAAQSIVYGRHRQASTSRFGRRQLRAKKCATLRSHGQTTRRA